MGALTSWVYWVLWHHRDRSRTCCSWWHQWSTSGTCQRERTHTSSQQSWSQTCSTLSQSRSPTAWRCCLRPQSRPDWYHLVTGKLSRKGKWRGRGEGFFGSFLSGMVHIHVNQHKPREGVIARLTNNIHGLIWGETTLCHQCSKDSDIISLYSKSRSSIIPSERKIPIPLHFSESSPSSISRGDVWVWFTRYFYAYMQNAGMQDTNAHAPAGVD